MSQMVGVANWILYVSNWTREIIKQSFFSCFILILSDNYFQIKRIVIQSYNMNYELVLYLINVIMVSAIKYFLFSFIIFLWALEISYSLLNFNSIEVCTVWTVGGCLYLSCLDCNFCVKSEWILFIETKLLSYRLMCGLFQK